MFTLPDVPGRYPVGATTFTVAVDSDVANAEERIIGEARLKASSGGRKNEPALKLEEIAFTAFYPARIRDARGKNLRRGLSWLPRPVSGMLRGYAHFSKWSYWLLNLLLGVTAHLIKIPVYANAPLLDPEQDKDFTGQAWHLVLFSHGLAGNRTNYSHICSRLASQGKVVLAFEHRDGTGPFVETRSAVPGKHAKGHPDRKLYLNPEDVLWADKEEIPKFALRQDQLRFRQLEVYLAFTHFKRFVESSIDTDTDEVPCSELHTVEGPWTFDLRSRRNDHDFWASWTKIGSRPKVQCDADICFMGHSFGGATVLSVLSTEPPTFSGQQFSHIACTHAIALDPWVDPLPLPGPTPLTIERSLGNERVRGPPELLVINSEGFTLWNEHLSRLEDIIKAWNEAAKPTDDAADQKAKGSSATLLTLLRCQHISFSDLGVLLPFGRMARDGRKFLDITCELAVAFLDGGFDEALERQNKTSGDVEDIKKHKADSKTEWKKRFVGQVGDIIVH